MVEQFIKFIERSPYKAILLKIVQDIMENNLEKYDIKPIEGTTNLYRIRKGSIRFIFRKTSQGNRIIEVNNRGDIYKGISRK